MRRRGLDRHNPGQPLGPQFARWPGQPPPPAGHRCSRHWCHPQARGRHRQWPGHPAEPGHKRSGHNAPLLEQGGARGWVRRSLWWWSDPPDVRTSASSFVCGLASCSVFLSGVLRRWPGCQWQYWAWSELPGLLAETQSSWHGLDDTQLSPDPEIVSSIQNQTSDYTDTGDQANFIELKTMRRIWTGTMFSHHPYIIHSYSARHSLCLIWISGRGLSQVI